MSGLFIISNRNHHLCHPFFASITKECSFMVGRFEEQVAAAVTDVALCTIQMLDCSPLFFAAFPAMRLYMASSSRPVEQSLHLGEWFYYRIVIQIKERLQSKRNPNSLIFTLRCSACLSRLLHMSQDHSIRGSMKCWIHKCFPFWLTCLLDLNNKLLGLLGKSCFPFALKEANRFFFYCHISPLFVFGIYCHISPLLLFIRFSCMSLAASISSKYWMVLSSKYYIQNGILS